MPWFSSDRLGREPGLHLPGRFDEEPRVRLQSGSRARDGPATPLASARGPTCRS
jgi:hypothetical protein